MVTQYKSSILNILLVGIVLFILGVPVSGIASVNDNSLIDSLEQLLASNPTDTIKIKTIVELARAYQYIDPEKGLKYGEQGLGIAEGLNQSHYVAISLNIIGENYHELSLYNRAIMKFEQALRLFIDLGDELGQSNCYSNLGLAENSMGNYSQAMDHFMVALHIREKLGNRALVRGSLTHLGLVYYYIGDTEKALNYFKMSMKISREMSDVAAIARMLNNIGVILEAQGKCREALIYQKKGLKMRIRIGAKATIASSWNNIGNCHDCLKDYDKAIMYFERSLTIKRELNDQHGIANGLRNIANGYSQLHEYSTSIKYLNESLEIAKTIGSKMYIKEAYKEFSYVYGKTRMYQEALKYYKLFVEKQDSLFNEDKSKDIGKLEARYEMQKKLEREKQEAEVKRKILEEVELRRNTLQYSGILIFIVLMATGVFMIGKFSLPIRLGQGLVFFTFLLFFEFTLVLLDPYIDRYSSGAPAIKLGFNAVLAAIIFPLHSFFEERLKKKLLEANE